MKQYMLELKAVGDRLGARLTMTATYILSALGMLGLLGASHPLGTRGDILAGGFAAGAFMVQNPLVMIESIGIRRLGSVMGHRDILHLRCGRTGW
jgi:hypothetical protein